MRGGRSEKAELTTFRRVYMQKFGWTLLLSLLASITTYQQNYDNYELVVTPNEMVGLYRLDYPLNDPLSFLSGLSLERGSSQRKQFTWCQDLPSTRIFLPLS